MIKKGESIVELENSEAEYETTKKKMRLTY